MGDDGRHLEDTVAEPDAVAAIGDVEPEGDALFVELPEAEGAGVGADAVAVGFACLIQAFVGGEVPGEDAFRDEGAPGELAVAALPGVTEDEEVGGDAEVPADVDQRDGLGGGREREDEAGFGEVGRDGDGGVLPLAGGGLFQAKFACGKGLVETGEGGDCIGNAEDREEARGAAA